MARKTNKTTVAVVMQPTQGVFVPPSTTDDVLPVSNLTFTIDGVTVTNDEYTGTIHKNGDDVAGKVVSGSFNIYLRPPGGSDVPGADEYLPGRYLKAAKFTEVITGTAIPAAAEALGAGSTTTTAVLGDTASATDDIYKAMAVQLSSIGTTVWDRVTAVRHYDGDSKTAELFETLSQAPTGTYQILKQLSYQRDMTEANPPFLSQVVWLDGVRYNLVDLSISGLRWNLPVSTRDGASQPLIEVSWTATIDSYVDEATPTVPALGATPLWKDGKFYVAGKAVGGSSLVVDFAPRVAYPPNPNYTDGSGPGEIVESRTTLNMDREAYTKAQFDTLAMAEGQQQYGVLAQWGYASGRMVQIVIPDARFNYQSPNLGQDFISETGDMWVDVFNRNVCMNLPYL